jgi:hypothetical protein
MKAYLLVTCILFALLVAVHIWRVIEEGPRLVSEPFFVFTTVASAALCLWSARLLWSTERREPRDPVT